jgi:hypothetical protein
MRSGREGAEVGRPPGNTREPAPEAGTEQKWQHGARSTSMKELGKGCLDERRRSRRSSLLDSADGRKELDETGHTVRPNTAGGLANDFHLSSDRSLEDRATRKAGACGASALSVLCRSDLAGLRTPCSRHRAGRVRTAPAVTLELCTEGPFVLADSYTELGARRWNTLNARPKGTRGRLRWFTPSRLAGRLKTAKIGKGQGGSTQPIRC